MNIQLRTALTREVKVVSASYDMPIWLYPVSKFYRHVLCMLAFQTFSLRTRPGQFR